jgi:hypothetical protein
MLVSLLSVPNPARSGPVDPWADAIVSWGPGATPAPGYGDPTTSLGSPERFTGEAFGFDSVVSMFSPPFGPEEIVSIGEGGHLTLFFDEPITDDPSHLYGVDFIVFGNTGFIDFNYPSGQIGSPAALFGLGLATIEVSADGNTFFPVPGLADGLFPTQAYLDSGPFDPVPGLVPTNFQRPVNPALSLNDFSGLSYAQALALYDGSGGGTPVDISSTGLAAASYVRISLADDGDAGTELHAELDAMALVPEPTMAAPLAALLGGGWIAGRPRRRSAQ